MSKKHYILDDVAYDDKISLGYMRVDYLQSSDGSGEDPKDEDCGEYMDQKLTIETRNSGGGHFLHIKTDGWSIDRDPEELTSVIRDFIKRMEMNSIEQDDYLHAANKSLSNK